MNITEKLIEDVREYLCDNLDEARDYLEEMGEDWVRFYTLDELYSDYCCGNLVELIDMFCESNASASDYETYYVYVGDIRDACDIGEDVEYTFDDDYWVERLIDYAESGKVRATSNLLKIIESGNASWQDVDDALHTHFHNSLVSEREAFNDPLYGNSPNEFAEVCRRIEDMRSAFNCLLKTKFSNIPEERYADIVSVLDGNPNWLMGVGMVARGYVKDGIPFAKGVEMYLKVGSSWFREED